MAENKRKLGVDSASESEELSSHDEDDIFEVERILAEDVVEDQTFYLVKWVNYGDHRSTWEPVASFENDETIKEWRQELARGDSLDKDEVEAVQARMDAYMEKRKRIDEKRERRSLRKKEGTEARDRARLQTKQRNIPVVTPSAQTNIKARPSQPISSNLVSNVPAAPERKTTTTATRPVMSPSEPSKFHFHAIASLKNNRRPSPPASEKSRRSKPAGVKFRNLQHMNNAQKRLDAERTPMTALQLKPVAELGTVSTRESEYSLPPSSERGGSPHFFPETKRGNSPQRNDANHMQPAPNGPLYSSLAGSPPREVSASGLPPAPPAAANSGAAITPFKPAKTIRTNSGRIFKNDEILVHLKFEDRDVGDALVAQFPPWLKTMMLSLKEEKALLLCFEHCLVFSAIEFFEVSRSWPPKTEAIGGIKPFADTTDSITSLAQYLQDHDLTALWEYPGEDETIGLVLYSPRAKSWSRHAREPNLRGCPLLLEARNRAYRGNKPISVRTTQVVMPGARGDPPSSLPTQGIFSNPWNAPFRPIPTRPLNPMHVLSEHHEYGSESRPDLHSGVCSLHPAWQYLVTNTLAVLDDGLAADEHGARFRESSVTKQAIGHADELDWSVKADFRSMTKTASSSTGKVFVYIAFAQQHPRQAKAMKDWAGKHTSPRFVYNDADAESEWDDFRSGTNTALLLFQKDNPSFCMLKEVYNLLGRDNVACYNVSWAQESKEVKYSFSRLFPRGSVLLLTEYTITRHPMEAAFAMEWFRLHAKKKGWMVMVRPNVRAWLQQKALECEDDEKAKRMFEVLRLLLRMSSITDVTVGDDVDPEDFLGIGNSGESEKDNFIVPLPPLAGYDTSSSAGGSTEAISKRDDLLLNHFIYWSIINASSYRRFIALDDLQARKGTGKGAAKPEGAEHIKFWKPETFMRDQQKCKSSDVEK